VNAAHAITESMQGTGEKGKIRVCTSPEGSAILITIADTGCGIPEANRSRVFDPFFTTKPHGIGMGLRISRSIVESHGGRLWAADNSPHGASFSFTLPIPVGEPEQPSDAHTNV